MKYKKKIFIVCVFAVLFGVNFWGAVNHVNAATFQEKWFDPAWYYINYYQTDSGIAAIKLKGDIVTWRSQLWNHYQTYGINNGYSPCVGFNPRFYLENNADIKAAYGSTGYRKAYEHFLLVLDDKTPSSRRFSMFFTASDYKNIYSDLSSMTTYQLFDHYCCNGVFETRRGSTTSYSKALEAMYHPEKYMAYNADLKKAYGSSSVWREECWRHFLVSMIGDEEYRWSRDSFCLGAYKFNYGLANNKAAFDRWINSGYVNKEDASGYYYITYDANGGSSAPSTQKKAFKTNLTLTSAVPVRTGYTFQGWGTATNSTSVSYAKGATYTADKSITLYAVWKVNTYTVAYHANGGTNAPASQTKTYNMDLTLRSETPTREGYIFQGWAKNQNATSATYQPSALYSSTAADQTMTLYAVWKIKTYTITYHSNTKDEVEIPEAQIKEHFEKEELSSAIPEREGYIFRGWATSSEADNAEYQPGDVYDGNEALDLYAIWSEKSYLIAYDVNGGKETTAPSPQVKFYFTDLELTTIIPERDHYVFKGWAVNENSTYPTYKVGEENYYKENKTMILYAVWELQTFTVTYSSEEGTKNLPKFQTKSYDIHITLSDKIPEREGYDFKGWSETENATVAKYEPGDDWTKNENTVLYAIWTLKTYNIHYEANASGEEVEKVPADQKKFHGQGLTLSPYVPVREGYDFRGWGISNAAQSAAYQPKAEYEKNEDITLFAIWDTKTYKITYDANDNGEGTAVPSDQTLKYNGYIIISANTGNPEREGHTFIGWSDRKSDTEAVWKKGDRYEKNENLTLYAVWKADSYTISYDMNNDKTGDTVEPAAIASQEKEHGKTIYLSNSVPARSGYGFLGWATSKTAKEAEYRAGASFTVNAATTLYAVWSANSYSVSFNANGTNVTDLPDAQTKKFGVALTLPSKKPVREGYTFLGWGTSRTDETASYQPGDTYSKDESVSLFAVWEQLTHTVQYDANGGSNAPTEQIKKYGQALSITGQKPERTGYDFLGWSLTQNASKAEYEAGSLYQTDYKENKTVTLYAVWKLKEYIVSYYLNYSSLTGTEVNPSDTVKSHGKVMELTREIPKREGYLFLGWSKNNQAETADYRYNEEQKAYLDTYDENESVKLYAIWSIKKYTITYDGNGSEENVPVPQTKTHGKDMILSKYAPILEGKQFLGWSKNKSASIASYQSGDTYSENGNVTLYAVWKEQTFTISYDANGGNNAPASQNKKYDVDCSLSLQKPTRTGYDFLGWSRSIQPKENDVSVYPGDVYSENTNLNLYAVWKQKSFTITYDANGGDDEPKLKKQEKLYGETLTLSTELLSRTGYEFLGWSTNPSAKKATYEIGDTYAEESNLGLYAVWKIKTYTITYQANGGSGVPEEQIKEYGTAIELSYGKPRRTGYNFIGWETEAGVGYEPGDKYTTNANLVLKAVWEKITYQVIYNANGGTGEPSSQSKNYGEALKLSSQLPVQTGYEFLGWAESASATSAKYKAGDTITEEKNIELYAVWKEIVYTITYQANGGSGAPASQTKKYDVRLVLSSALPKRTGYAFKGWSIKENVSEAEYQPGDDYDRNANLTLYAVWEVNKYTVDFDGNGGNGAPDSQEKTHGTDLALSKMIPTRTGYDFLGWAESAGAVTAKYQPGDKYTIEKEITLYAVWKIKEYSIAYDGNGGMNVPSAQTKIYGVPLELSKKAPKRDGYSFMGWSLKKNETEAAYQLGEEYTANESVTLYAVWSIDKFEVNYDANGGEEAPVMQLKTYGTNLTLSKVVPVRTGYDFLGWAESVTAVNAKYQAGDKYSAEKTVTLYAVWKLKEYSVTYHVNGGSGEPAAQIKYYGKRLKLSTTKPVKDGYNFKGWAISSASGTVNYQAGAEYEGNEKLELYAVWAKNSDSQGSSNVVKGSKQKITMSVKKSKVTVVYGTKSIYLNARTNGGGKLTYQSTQKKVAAVSKTGQIKIKGYGETVITVTAKAKGNFGATEKQFTLTVVPEKALIEKVAGTFRNSPNTLGVKIIPVTKVSGYQIQIAKDSKFKKIQRNAEQKSNVYTAKKMQKKTYYIRVRAYKKVGKRTFYGVWSSVKSVKVS